MSENEKRGFTRRNFVKGRSRALRWPASALGASSMFGCSPSVNKKGRKAPLLKQTRPSRGASAMSTVVATAFSVAF